MKSLSLILALITITHSLFAEPTMKTAPISGDDITNMLGLKTSKTTVTFNSPKNVILRCESNGSSRDFPITGLSESITLLTHIPSEGGPIRPCHFWITGAGRTTSSSFAFDSSKAIFTRSEIIDGTYTVSAFRN